MFEDGDVHLILVVKEKKGKAPTYNEVISGLIDSGEIPFGMLSKEVIEKEGIVLPKGQFLYGILTMNFKENF